MIKNKLCNERIFKSFRLKLLFIIFFEIFIPKYKGEKFEIIWKYLGIDSSGTIIPENNRRE